MPTLPLSESAHTRWGTGLRLQGALDSMHRHLDARLSKFNVTFAQSRALMFLLDAPMATLGDVALATQTDNGAMTRLVERLRAKQLCTCVRGAHDRRVVEVSLTDEGIRVARCIGAILDDVLALHLGGVSREDRETLDRSLSCMVDNGRPSDASPYA